MKISTNNLVPISDANQNFSQVAKRVDKDGSAIIMKNNKPRYLLVPFQQAEREQNEEDDVFEITQRLLKKNQVVYNELKKKDS
ncbi:MAG TPA: type II toxin-antitoxin system prevent-host-death family antitoxin [Clostridiales bacterium]|jgi:antitoxin Phd|nr:type II toxin-antitoxin system prevent-host-death family antitoxin [Clostridiales bacterium]HCC02351.1 type II toxin-antitoxin system prevent-host-death family antitoxin [Oscillospiraceae bacterium]